MGRQEDFKIAYSFVLEFKDTSPISNPESPLEFSVSRIEESEEGVAIGNIVNYEIKVSNKNSEIGQGMTIALIHI